MEDGVRQSSCAAQVKLNRRAAASKARNAGKGGMLRLVLDEFLSKANEITSFEPSIRESLAYGVIELHQPRRIR
jgi:hypothetical protein